MTNSEKFSAKIRGPFQDHECVAFKGIDVQLLRSPDKHDTPSFVLALLQTQTTTTNIHTDKARPTV